VSYAVGPHVPTAAAQNLVSRSLTELQPKRVQKNIRSTDLGNWATRNKINSIVMPYLNCLTQLFFRDDASKKSENEKSLENLKIENTRLLR